MYTLLLKIASRYLLKNKLYSFINIFGLAIGVASFVLIMLYVNYERSYDTFEGSDQVYRLYIENLKGDTYQPSDAQTFNLSGPTAKEMFPEIKEFVRFGRFTSLTVVKDNKTYDLKNGTLADNSYFDVFNNPLIKGNQKTALIEPYSMVLSESMAEKIFADEDPIGKSVSLFNVGQKGLFTVTGVVQDILENTHIKINALISFDTFKTWDGYQWSHEMEWNNNNFYTYIKVDENTDIEELRDKITALRSEDGSTRHNIEALESIHLHSDKPFEAEANGSVSRVKFLTAIAFIILILSWLNYVNLSTTKTLERAKEVGIRKVSGAQKPQLILQSLLESSLLNVISIGIAFGLVIVLLPVFDRYIGKELSFGMDDLYTMWPGLAFIAGGCLLVGLYPAFVLSRYSPVRTLKGEVKTSARGLNIRKGLIVFQFLATIVLLVGTILVTKQINFIQQQPLGFDAGQTLALNGKMLTETSDSLLLDDFQTLKAELQKLPFVRSAAVAETYPGDGFDNLSSSNGITYPDGTFSENDIWYTYAVQPDYFELMKMEFLAGHPFTKTATNHANSVVINETFARKMGFVNMEDAVDKTIKFWGGKWAISGIVKDYHHFGLKSPIQPMIMRYGREPRNLLVGLETGSASSAGIKNALAEIEKTWNKVIPQSTFEYTFLDKKFEAQYNEDKKFGEAFGLFTFLAILIASMGLFGLTSYTVVQRRKEIGIRKVNGATITQILTLLNKNFVKWVGLAFIIAVPIAWYAMGQWLNGFAYKTTMSWWIFVLAGVSAMVIALLTVSWQSFRAAVANPAEALRDE